MNPASKGGARAAMGDESAEGPKRKRRSGDDVTRVAEIVMVLEAMGRMRGGREPTQLEKDLAAEARGRLVEMCAALRPSDLFTSDAARLVAGDLGFNKDPIGGSRAAVRRMSIAEKLSNTKKKMEEVKEFTMQTPQNPSSVQSGGPTKKPEGHPAVFHGSNRLVPDKPNQAHINASTVFVPVVPLGHVTTLASSIKQSQFSETPLRPAASSMERDSSLSATTRNEAGHFKMDARSSGMPYVSNVQATYSAARVPEKTTASPIRSSSGAMNKPTHVTKLIDNVFPKSENAHAAPSFQTSSHVKLEQAFKGSTVNTLQGNMSTGQQPQNVNLGHAPLSTASHFDIARTIQKVLHPTAAELPGWSPPLVDYMTQTLNCQICKISISDLESLLVCDACEKGVHLRCLKSFTQRSVSNAEWHCPKCLLTSNGKPLPPKYGKVTRNIGASRASSSNTSGPRASSEKRSEHLGTKVANQCMAPNTATTANPSPAYTVSVSHSQPEPDTKALVAEETQHNDAPCHSQPEPDTKALVAEETQHNDAPCHSQPEPDKKALVAEETQHNDAPTHGSQKVDDTSKEIDASDIKENGDSNCVKLGAPMESSNQCKLSFGLTSCNMQGQISESSSEPKDKLTHLIEPHMANDKVPYHSQRIAMPENVAEMPCSETVSNDLHQKINDHEMKEMKKSHESMEISNPKAYGTDNKEYRSSNLVGVEWVGAIIDTSDGKTYYQSCRVNSLVHSLQDVLLISSDNLGISPAKLQVLWENNKDGSKWAIVNQFYSPNDLPDFITRPSTPENDEVYESNDSVTIEAGRIHGPCVVLPLVKFIEESERRTTLSEAEKPVHPIFLCRWFYDKSKSLFQPIIESFGESGIYKS